MNFKTNVYLFVAIAVLIGVLVVSQFTGPKKGEEGKLLPGIDPKDVTRVTVERKLPAENKLVFARVDKDQWKLEEPYQARVDGHQVDSLMTGLTSAMMVTKGADLTSNPARFGLDRPAVTVTLEAGGKTVTANFGQVTIGPADSSLVYVNTADHKAPMAVKRSSLSGLFRDLPDAKTAGDLFKPASEFRARDLLLADASFNAVEVVKSIHLQGAKGDIVINKTSAGTWQFEKPTGYGDADLEGDMSGAGADAAPSGIKPLLTALAAIRVNSGDDFIENVTDFKQYGLEPGKAAGPRIEIVRKGQGEDAPPVTEVLTVGKKEDKGDKVFVRPGNENAVAKVPANLIEPIVKLIENPSALRSRALLPNGTAGVDALDIRVGGDAPIELRKLADGWKLFGPGGDPKAANVQTVQGLVTELGGHRLIRDFPDPKLTDADKGFDHPSAVVTLWDKGIVEEPKPEEKKADKKPGEEQQQPPEKKDEPKDKAPKKDEKPAAKPEPKKEEPKKPAMPKLKDPTAKLIFGKRDKDLLFVRREIGATKADFAVPESLLPKLTRGRLDYLDTTIPSFTTDQVTKLTFTHAGETWVVEEVKDKNPPAWVIRQPASLAGRPAEPFKISALLGDLSALRAERLWAEKATDKELERFGLKAPRLTMTVALADTKDKERSYLFGAETDDKAQVYAKQGDHDLIFSVAKSTVDAFQKADVVDPTVFRLDLSKVTGMKLTGWATLQVDRKPQILDLERKGANNWAVKAPPAFKLSASQAESLLTALALVQAEKVVVYKTGPKPEFKLATAEGALTIDISMDGQKEPVTLVLGAEAEGGKSYYAQSNKTPGDVFLVPKERFEKYRASPIAFAAE